MTEEQKLLLKMLLKVLDRVPQSEESILYHSVCLAGVNARWSDYEWALGYADEQRWIDKVSGGPLKTTKWHINDLGRAALLQM